MPEVTSEIISAVKVDARRLRRAIDSAIRAMITNIDPITSELLDDIMVLRDIRNDIDASMRGAEFAPLATPEQRQRLIDAGIDAGGIDRNEATVSALSQRTGVPPRVIMAAAVEKFEKRLRDAGIDLSALKADLDTALQSGDPDDLRRVVERVTRLAEGTYEGNKT